MSDDSDRLRFIHEELKIIRQNISKVVNYMIDAEREVPERMRRFIMYMHDIHDIINMHTELGHEVPRHVLQEAERCDDRLRQILTEMHTDGGAFEKVRAEMAKDPTNRWDHTRQLAKPKGEVNETRSS